MKKLTEKENKKLVDFFKEMFDCEFARLSQPTDKIFLIIGEKRNTKEDHKDSPTQWKEYVQEQWIPRDWEYVNEKVIASGNTIEELIKSAEKYKKISKMTMEEYLESETFLKESV